MVRHEDEGVVVQAVVAAGVITGVAAVGMGLLEARTVVAIEAEAAATPRIDGEIRSWAQNTSWSMLWMAPRPEPGSGRRGLQVQGQHFSRDRVGDIQVPWWEDSVTSSKLDSGSSANDQPTCPGRNTVVQLESGVSGHMGFVSRDQRRLPPRWIF